MAKHEGQAPRPGIGKRKDEAAAAAKVLELTIRGETVRLSVGAITVDDRNLIRSKMHGTTFAEFMAKFDLDSLFVIWWMAKRQAVPSFSYEEAKAKFPWDLSDESEVDLQEVTAGDNPEA